MLASAVALTNADQLLPVLERTLALLGDARDALAAKGPLTELVEAGHAARVRYDSFSRPEIVTIVIGEENWREELAAAGKLAVWRRLRVEHLYRDAVLPLANTAIRARAAGPLDSHQAALVTLACDAARERVCAGDLLVLLAAGRARTAATAALLRAHPALYARLIQRQWQRRASAA